MSNMVTATYSGESAKQVFDPNNDSYPKPYIIATSGVPLIVIGSGTVNSSGGIYSYYSPSYYSSGYC